MLSLSDAWSGITASPLALMLRLRLIGVVEPGVGVRPTAPILVLTCMLRCIALSCFIVFAVFCSICAPVLLLGVPLPVLPDPGLQALMMSNIATVANSPNM